MLNGSYKNGRAGTGTGSGSRSQEQRGETTMTEEISKLYDEYMDSVIQVPRERLNAADDALRLAFDNYLDRLMESEFERAYIFFKRKFRARGGRRA